MDDPKQLDPALALALVSGFYSLFIIFAFILPVKHKFIHSNDFKLKSKQKDQLNRESKVANKAVGISSASILLTVLVLFPVFYGDIY